MTTPTVTAVEQALQKARQGLLQWQRFDGSFNGDNHGGPMYTAMWLITVYWLGTLQDADAKGVRRELEATQLKDGSWPEYPFARQGGLEATVLCRAALTLCGGETRAIEQASEFISGRGKDAQLNLYIQVYLVMAGERAAASLPRLTLLWKLLPFSQRLLGTRFGLEMVLVANQLPLITNGLRRQGKAMRWWRHPLASFTEWRARRYLYQRQNANGSWAGIIMPTLFAIIALRNSEAGRTSAFLRRGTDYLAHWKHYTEDGRLQVLPYTSEVWNSALCIRALLHAGQAPDSLPMQQALAYVWQNQGWLNEPADWQNPRLSTPRQGGWPYEDGNPLCCDSDTTAAALWSLAELSKAGCQDWRMAQSLLNGTRFLLGMQNPGGGWAAFARGLADKPAGPAMTSVWQFPKPSLGQMIKLFLNPPLICGDPATAGLTGRVLCALGAMGYHCSHPVVSRSIAFIEAQIDPRTGAWWGRWEVNFLQATACVLSGLQAVGVDMEQPWITRAKDWLLACQNQDGSWGETPDSYAEPSLAGQGDGCATITGAVMSCLLDLGDGNTDAVARGMSWLLNHQQQDGLWAEPQALFVMVPPNTFYTNYVYAQYSPVEALGKYGAPMRAGSI